MSFDCRDTSWLKAAASPERKIQAPSFIFFVSASWYFVPVIPGQSKRLCFSSRRNFIQTTVYKALTIKLEWMSVKSFSLL